MTEAIKNWILSILAAGLVLFLVVVSPLAAGLPDWVGQALGEELELVAVFSDDLEETNESYLETIMSQRASEYIVTQAEEMGLSLTASVTCDWTEEGLPVPAEAVLRGQVPEQARETLTNAIQEQLGIQADHITYEEAAS